MLLSEKITIIEQALKKAIDENKPSDSDDLIFLELEVPYIACDIAHRLYLQDDQTI